MTDSGPDGEANTIRSIIDNIEGLRAKREFDNQGPHANAAFIVELENAWPTIRAELEKKEREIAELTLEIFKIKNGDAWQAFEQAKAELGRIIGDDYAARSMWPRLARTKQWWDSMKARAEAAEAELAALSHSIQWLLGEAPDVDGKWFGECQPAKYADGEPRKYWWRSKFRAMLAAAPSHPEEETGQPRVGPEENDRPFHRRKRGRP